MQKIRVLTDSASDLPQELACRNGITVLPIPISHEGRTFLERVDFTNGEFYRRMLGSKEIPSTSHITAQTYLEKYEEAFAEGADGLLNVTINSLGSSMFSAACMAKKMFCENHPEAGFRIEVVDSKTYTMAYGIAVLHAAEMLQAGAEFDAVLSMLEDWFARVEILCSVYSLEFVKKSGRVTPAAAFVGEILGMRPLITFIGGVPKVLGKVRGDKNVVPRLFATAKNRMSGSGYPVLIMCGTPEREAQELGELVRKELDEVPFAGTFSVGASIAINSGPQVVALVYAGEKREAPARG